MLFFISTPRVSYLVRSMRVSAGMHAVLVIPHEVISIILLILGLFLFSRERKQDKWLAGLIGGIVTLLSVNYAVYYALSLVVYAIIRAVKTKKYKFYFFRLIVTGFITFLISSVYLVPYILSMLKHGSDNFQWIQTSMSNFDPFLVTFGLGFMGLTFILGVLGIITLPKSNFKLILIITLFVLYAGRFHVYITKPLFNISYIPDHAYYALVFFLSFTGAIFLRDFPMKIGFRQWTLGKVKIGHIFLASTFFLPILIWTPISNQTIYNSFKPVPEKIHNITSVLKEKTETNDIILASNEISPWILLLSRRHLALSGSPWCSNPTARYSLRYKNFSESFSDRDIKVIKEKLDKWNVNIIVFAKEDNKWVFRASSPEFGMLFSPSGLKAEIDKKIFDNNEYFEKVYEDDFYIVLKNN